MKLLPTLFLAMLFAVSCYNETTERQTSHLATKLEFMEKLDGEWAVRDDWRSSTLNFSNRRHKNYKQEIFPSYNTIIFNKNNNTIVVNTYGEFGVGMGALNNLKINNSKWNVKNGMLHLKFDYTDYSGQHHLESVFSIERKAQQLILKKAE